MDKKKYYGMDQKQCDKRTAKIWFSEPVVSSKYVRDQRFDGARLRTGGQIDESPQEEKQRD